jgi:hypothetical protein
MLEFSAEWMVNKEKQAVQKLSEAVLAKSWKRFVKPGAPGPLSQEALVAREDDWLQPYCTSTVIELVAVTRSWSFVAPFTVILCVPLLRPLSSPLKPF